MVLQGSSFYLSARSLRFVLPYVRIQLWSKVVSVIFALSLI